MNQEDVEKIVALAEGASAQVKDPGLKEVTFKTVLTELLRQSASPTPQLPPPILSGLAAQPIIGSTQAKAGTPQLKLAEWVGTAPEILTEIFEFGDNSVTVRLPQAALPNRMADAQRLLAHIKLAVDKIGYERDEVPAQEMIELFDDHGCKDGNVAKNLKASPYIVPKGGKNTMKTYKMRYSGIAGTLNEVRSALGIQA